MTEVTIADANLRLALVDEVSVARVGDYYWLASLREPYTAYRATAGGPTWDELEARLGIDHLPELEQFVRGLPLPADELAAVTDLCLDGDREVYTVHPGWWHVGGRFDIADLDGIGHCAAVTDLNLGQGMFDRCSLVPLADLPTLRHLRMCTLDRYTDVDALLRVASLATVRVANLAHAPDAATWSAVIAALRAKGVTVTA